jgi:tetratricopeptide (TPR) repeat protein
VANFSTLEEIAAAYKQKYAELFSSDSPLANIPRLRELKDAFDLLSDDNKRDEYDEKLAEFLEDINEKYEEAVEHLSRGELQQAVDKLNWCIGKNPGEPDYYETIGLVYRLANDYDSAVKSFKQGLETGQRKAFFHRNLGDIYRLKHDEDNSDTHYLEAAEAFKAILQVDPKNVEAIEQLADIYGRMKFYDESLDLYQQLLRRFPYNAGYHRETGGILYELDMTDEAEQHLLEALRITPGDPAALLFLGLVYFKRRLLGMAVQTLRDSLAHAPDQPEVKQLIAQIETIRGEIGKTVEEIVFDPAPDAYVEGLVKWYNPETGMGVLSCDEYPEVLLHFSAIKNEAEVQLKKGDTVRFGVVKDSMSPIAVQVEKIGETEVSESMPGRIAKFDAEKKMGIIKGHDGREVYFSFSVLTEEVLENLKPELEVLFESRTITGLSDNPFEQATRVRLRKRKLPPVPAENK